MKALLLSNSTAPGKSYLEHAKAEIDKALAGRDRVVFFPFALADHDGYTNMVSSALGPIPVVGAHQEEIELTPSDLVFIGGGNSFRLFDQMHRRGWAEKVRKALSEGTGYLGSSAGTNIAAPQISTTNDMPIVWPVSPLGLRLVPFQINPHYIDAPDADGHQGETREQRLEQYLEENTVPVVAMREGSWLSIEAGRAVLGGVRETARIFRQGRPAYEVPTGTDVLAELGLSLPELG